jgi:hypothetical protein
LKAGWNWLTNSKKWHYFGENGRSLCGRYMVFVNDDAEADDTESPDNCAECWKRRQKARGEG